MARVDIKVTEIGSQAVIAKLSGTMKRMGDLTPALKKGGIMMLRSIHLNFQQGGRPIPWRMLAASTLIQKLKKGYSFMPLIRTGQLRQSIVYDVRYRRKLAVGTSVKYAKFHHFGTRRMPKRRFVMFQLQDVKRINQLVLEHITGKSQV